MSGLGKCAVLYGITCGAAAGVGVSLIVKGGSFIDKGGPCFADARS